MAYLGANTPVLTPHCLPHVFFGVSQPHCEDRSAFHEATAQALQHVGRQTQADFDSRKVLRKGR